MTYMFMSFSTYGNGNIGCCIVRVDNPDEANSECERLGLMPPKPNDARGFVLEDESWEENGMELNKFYSRNEMMQMGFQKDD